MKASLKEEATQRRENNCYRIGAVTCLSRVDNMFEKYFNRDLHPLDCMHRLDRSLSIMTLVRAGGSLYRLCMCLSVES